MIDIDVDLGPWRPAARSRRGEDEGNVRSRNACQRLSHATWVARSSRIEQNSLKTLGTKSLKFSVKQ